MCVCDALKQQHRKKEGLYIYVPIPYARIGRHYVFKGVVMSVWGWGWGFSLKTRAVAAVLLDRQFT